MKSPIYRRMMALALALGVAACGGKATFDIKGQIAGLEYDSLVLTETISGTKVTVKKGTGTTTPFQFPNSIEYGTAYNVQILATTDQPPHQQCAVVNGADTAGRLATIDIGVQCTLIPHNLAGTIKIDNADKFPTAEVTGLTLTNGSTFNAFVATKDTTVYGFSGIPFGTTYGLIISQQPTVTATSKVTCVLATDIVATPPAKGMGEGNLSFTNTMTDVDAKVDVVCTAR